MMDLYLCLIMTSVAWPELKITTFEKHKHLPTIIIIIIRSGTRSAVFFFFVGSNDRKNLVWNYLFVLASFAFYSIIDWSNEAINAFHDKEANPRPYITFVFIFVQLRESSVDIWRKSPFVWGCIIIMFDFVKMNVAQPALSNVPRIA